MRKCIKYEIYKFLIVKKGILILIGYLFLQALSTIMNPRIQIYKETESEQKYNRQYYGDWGGYLNDDKAAQIDDWMLSIQKAEIDYNNARFDFYSNKISIEEYVKASDESLDLINQKRIFEKFYQNYSYCKQDISNRELINTTGWSLLLESNSINYFLLFVCILIGTIVFSADYESNGMEQIIKTTKNGRGSTFLAKIITILFMVTILEIIEFSLNYFVMNYYFTLNHFSSPLQSIQEFKELSFRISIGMTLFVLFLIKLLGMFYMSIIAAFAVELIRKGYVGFLSNVFLYILMYFLFSESSFLYKIPIPLSCFMDRQLLKNGLPFDVIIYSVFIIVLIIGSMSLHYIGKGKILKWKIFKNTKNRFL